MSNYNCYLENNSILCSYPSSLDLFEIFLKSLVFTVGIFGYLTYMYFMYQIVNLVRVPMKELTIITGIPGIGYTRYINQMERLYMNRRSDPGSYIIVTQNEISIRRALALGYNRIYVFIENHLRDFEIEKIGKMMGYDLNRIILWHSAMEDMENGFIRFLSDFSLIQKRKIRKMITRLFFKTLTLDMYRSLGYKVIECNWITQNENGVWVRTELEEANEEELDNELKEYMENNVKN